MKLVYTCDNPLLSLCGTNGDTILGVHSAGSYRVEFDLNALISDGNTVVELASTFKRTIKELHHASTLMYQQHRHTTEQFETSLRAARDKAEAAHEGIAKATREHAYNAEMAALSQRGTAPFADLGDVLPQ